MLLFLKRDKGHFWFADSVCLRIVDKEASGKCSGRSNMPYFTLNKGQ